MATTSQGSEPLMSATPIVQAPGQAPHPTSLHREPSQQDLEIARQLQSFQSQGANHHTQERDVDVVSHSSREAHEGQGTSEHGGSVDGRYLGTSDAPIPSELHPQRPPSTEPPSSGQVCTNCGTTKTPLWRRSPAGAVICNACGLYYKARNQMRPVGLKRTAGAAPAQVRTNETAERGTSPTALQGGATYVSADQSTNGTCPGGGRCNGTGGHDGCNGCPAYNNRISKTAQVALRQTGDGADAATGATEQQTNGHAAPQTVVVACQNCGTTITPLWRRDEAGNAICNACGLYYKLHGQHRPVQMKKAEIKRRKRVVPAALPTDSQYGNDSEGARTPESRSVPLMHTHPVVIMEPRTGPGPIPVDFTDAFRSRQAQSDSHDSIPSKRAYSETTEHYPHAQNMGFNPVNAIDPALPPNKEARRAELQREADRMRQMLMEKERELAALGDDV